MYYILDDNGNLIKTDVLTWGRWFAEHHKARWIDSTDVNGARVSTVFLGLDHGAYRGDPNRPPVLWETMVFGGGKEGDDDGHYQRRYTSREDAIAGHAAAVEWVLSGMIGDGPQ